MVKKFQENVDELSDTSIWPTGTLNILLRAGVDRFIFVVYIGGNVKLMENPQGRKYSYGQ